MQHVLAQNLNIFYLVDIVIFHVIIQTSFVVRFDCSPRADPGYLESGARMYKGVVVVVGFALLI